jgi:hypothetical protein
MKMVKSLLLGSAAGVVAVAGAQAADLPVKAKPVEYVKVCSLYGAGYYYIPGTDVCMRIGGYVRQEWSYGYGSSMTFGPWTNNYGYNTRTDATTGTSAADPVWRTRAYLTQETRQQTAYGTLRTYLNIGLSGDNGVAFSANRAFIQIAGFTVGLASSYFDHYSVAAIAYLVDASSDTGDGGQQVFAYTAQLGNGVSASIAAEQPANKRRTLNIVDADGAPTNFAIAGGPPNNYAKLDVPDIVANLRVDQAWGSAQVMGVLHQVNAGYYGGTTTGGTTCTTGGTACGAAMGHPDDKWGWAVGAGLKINLPMIARGDYIAVQAAYAEGASRYVANTAPNGAIDFGADGTLGYGITSDGVMAAAGGDIELTTMWGVAGGWEHFWTPSLRTSIHGSYVETKYNDNANALLCTAQGAAVVSGGIRYLSGTCDQNWSAWQVGSRTQWNVTKDFYMGFDVVYYKLNTASKGAVVNWGGSGAQPNSTRTLDDQDAVAVRVRWHRDIVP